MSSIQFQTNIDKNWESLWPINNLKPLVIVDLLSYLLFLKRMDEWQITKEDVAELKGKPVENPIYTKDEAELRWGSFKDMDPENMLRLFTKENGVISFVNNYSKGQHIYSKFLKAPLLLTPSAKLLKNVVDIIKSMDGEDGHTSGEAYEYILSKLSATVQNGQLPTPPHIIKLMVELMQPTPEDIIGDPAAGIGTFLLAGAEYLKDKYETNIPSDRFVGVESDPVMMRIGAMNMILHGIENPKLKGSNALNKAMEAPAEQVTLVMANPPFVSTPNVITSEDNQSNTIDNSKPGLTYLSLILNGLKKGGRAAVILPESILLDNGAAHKQIRQDIIDNHKLEGIISMPAGTFKPYTAVGTDILIFTKTATGGTDKVWFYDMKADCLSPDDRWMPVNIGKESKLRFPDDYGDIPEVLNSWKNRKDIENENNKSFFVTVEAIRENGYNLKINNYKPAIKEQISNVIPDEPVQKNSRPKGITSKNINPDILKEKPVLSAPKKRQSKRLTADTFLPLLLIICLGALPAYFLFFNKHEKPNILATTQSVAPPLQQSIDNKPGKNNNLPTTKSIAAAEGKIKKEPVNAPVIALPVDNKTSVASASVQKVNNNTAIVQTPQQKISPISSNTNALAKGKVIIRPDRLSDNNTKLKYEIASKAYLYDEPEAGTRQKASIVSKNDYAAALNALDEKNGYIYTVVTNHQGQTYRGWMRKKDLRPVRMMIDDDDVK